MSDRSVYEELGRFVYDNQIDISMSIVVAANSFEKDGKLIPSQMLRKMQNRLRELINKTMVCELRAGE